MQRSQESNVWAASTAAIFVAFGIFKHLPIEIRLKLRYIYSEQEAYREDDATLPAPTEEKLH